MQSGLFFQHTSPTCLQQFFTSSSENMLFQLILEKISLIREGFLETERRGMALLLACWPALWLVTCRAAPLQALFLGLARSLAIWLKAFSKGVWDLSAAGHGFHLTK